MKDPATPGAKSLGGKHRLSLGRGFWEYFVWNRFLLIIFFIIFELLSYLLYYGNTVNYKAFCYTHKRVYVQLKQVEIIHLTSIFSRQVSHGPLCEYDDTILA